MNPYIIERPQFNLVDAFSRGREQGQNFRANQQSLAENDYKLSEAKRLKDEREAIVRIGTTLLKQTGGDLGKAQQLGIQSNPELAGPLSVYFQAIRGNSPDPMKQRKDDLELKALEQKAQEPEINRYKQMAYILGMQPNEAVREQQEQLMFPRPLTQLQSDIPLDGTPEQLQAYGLGPEKYAEMMQKKGATSDPKPFFRDEPGQEPLLVYPDGTVKKLGLKPKPIKQPEPKAPKTFVINGRPYRETESGDLVPIKYDKPTDLTNKELFNSLPIESQEQIKTLSTASARKKSIVNSMSGYLSEYDKALAKYQKSKSKTDYNDVIRIGSQALKTLNSPEGADAIGAEEAKRLGTALEFNWGNLVNPGAIVGRDLSGFSRQIKNTMGAIKTGLKANDDYIKSLYKTGEQYDPETFFK